MCGSSPRPSVGGVVGERAPRIGAPMNFRLVWVGSDDDSDGDPSAQGSAAASLLRSGTTSYELRGTEMVRCERLDNGRRKVIPVANFHARIVRDLVLDDEAEAKREFVVEAMLGGQRISFSVSAAEFGRMGWVLNKLGPEAILYPGQQQHARAAVQCLSGAIRKERIFTHLGWRGVGRDWAYLQSGGAIGGQGLRCDVQVQLPTALEHYRLPLPGDHH